MSRARVAIALAATLVTAIPGCGGRMIDVDGDGNARPGGNAGTSGESESGNANPGETAGAGGSSLDVANSTVVAGDSNPVVGDGLVCQCPTIQCAPGKNLVALPGNCRLVCDRCDPANCPSMPACGPGEVSVTLLGECCPTACASSSDGTDGVTRRGGAADGGPPDCARGQAEYASQLTAVLGILSACKDDSECVAAGVPGNPIVLDSPCGSPCGLAFSDSPAGAEIASSLNASGARECERCGPSERFSCAPVRAAGQCVNGRCQAVPL